MNKNKAILSGIAFLFALSLLYSYDIYKKQEYIKTHSKVANTLSSLVEEASIDGYLPLYGINHATRPLSIFSEEYRFVDTLIKKACKEPIYAEKSSGYTKYGAFFGDSYGEWCTEFALWCVIQTQNELGVKYLNVHYPDSSWSGGCVRWYKNKNLFFKREEYIPRRGDMIFFDYQQDGITDHTGLVMGVEYEGDTLYILTIEGNLPEDYPTGKIVQRRLKYNDSKIYGYGSF